MHFPSLSFIGYSFGGLLFLGSTCLAQPAVPEGKQTRHYSSGVGRITWTIPKDLEVVFAVPHWTAGPRILCANRRYECEIQVGPRNISISAEERLQELETKVKPILPDAIDKTFKPHRHGVDKSVTYTTLQDSRPNQPFRFLTIGYAQRGGGLIKFQALTNDALDIVNILNLVDSAKPLDVKEMWAFRFADYKAVCEERFPMYKDTNNTAFSSSPFPSVDLVGFFMSQNSSRTEEITRNELTAARQSYAKEFDGLPQTKRQSFCETLPSLIGEAAKDIPNERSGT